MPPTDAAIAARHLRHSGPERARIARTLFSSFMREWSGHSPRDEIDTNGHDAPQTLQER